MRTPASASVQPAARTAAVPATFDAMRDLTPEQRRAAEVRLVERYAAEVSRRVEVAPGERTPWKVQPGQRNVFTQQTGAHVEELSLEGVYPGTQVVLSYRHRLRPDLRFEIAWDVWPGDASAELDPPYDEAFLLNLRESLIDQVGEVHPEPRIPLRRVTCTSTPEQRRAAEERLRARYEAELTETIELGPDEITKWPVGPGTVQVTEADTGAFVEEVRLEGAFPNSQIVIVFRHQFRPEDRLACDFGVWPLGSLNEPEPPYNAVLWVNFDEWLATNLDRAPALRD
jgi:hypothetical protein